MVTHYVREERLPLNSIELDELIDDLIAEMTGLGPIEPLLKDSSISDILINTHSDIYVERAGVLEKVPVLFKDEDHLLRIINKIVSAVGRRVDESQPMCDARLADGSRINVAIRPIAVDGPLVSIRKFSRRAFSLDRLVEIGSLKSQAAAHAACRLTTGPKALFTKLGTWRRIFGFVGWEIWAWRNRGIGLSLCLSRSHLRLVRRPPLQRRRSLFLR